MVNLLGDPPNLSLKLAFNIRPLNKTWPLASNDITNKPLTRSEPGVERTGHCPVGKPWGSLCLINYPYNQGYGYEMMGRISGQFVEILLAVSSSVIQFPSWLLSKDVTNCSGPVLIFLE